LVENYSKLSKLKGPEDEYYNGFTNQGIMNPSCCYKKVDTQLKKTQGSNNSEEAEEEEQTQDETAPQEQAEEDVEKKPSIPIPDELPPPETEPVEEKEPKPEDPLIEQETVRMKRCGVVGEILKCYAELFMQTIPVREELLDMVKKNQLETEGPKKRKLAFSSVQLKELTDDWLIVVLNFDLKFKIIIICNLEIQLY